MMNVKVGQTVRLEYLAKAGWETDYCILKVTLSNEAYIQGFNLKTKKTEVWFNDQISNIPTVLLEPNQEFVDPKSFLAESITVSPEDQIKIYKILHPEAHDVRLHETGYLVVTQKIKTAIVAFGDEEGTTTLIFTNQEGEKMRFEKRHAYVELEPDEVRQVIEHYGAKYES